MTLRELLHHTTARASRPWIRGFCKPSITQNTPAIVLATIAHIQGGNIDTVLRLINHSLSIYVHLFSRSSSTSTGSTHALPSPKSTLCSHPPTHQLRSTLINHHVPASLFAYTTVASMYFTGLKSSPQSQLIPLPASRHINPTPHYTYHLTTGPSSSSSSEYIHIKKNVHYRIKIIFAVAMIDPNMAKNAITRMINRTSITLNESKIYRRGRAVNGEWHTCPLPPLISSAVRFFCPYRSNSSEKQYSRGPLIILPRVSKSKSWQWERCRKQDFCVSLSSTVTVPP